jgi:predicted DNA-binding transcriptional regulator AlpA
MLAMRDTQNEYLDTAQAAHYLGYSKSNLELWRTMSPRRGPDYFKAAGRVKYKKSDLDAWMEAGRVKAGG